MEQIVGHEGIVVAVEGMQARVRILQTSACSACHAQSMCMAAESKEKIIDCQMLEPLHEGDKVVVQVQRRLGLQAVLWAFVLPFVILLTMIWGLGKVWDNEALVGTVALCSLLPYYGILSLFKKRLKRKFSFVAKKTDNN